MMLSARWWFLIGFGACFSMMAVAAWFQFVENLQPCPLCISQRIMVVAVGLLFLIAAIHNPAQLGRRIYAVSGTVFSLIGAGISIRHVWIQNMPADQLPECGPGLAYVFEYFPLIETVKLMLSGTGDCAEVLWTFLGLSIPAWTLVAFIGLALYSLAQFWNSSTNRPSDLFN